MTKEFFEKLFEGTIFIFLSGVILILLSATSGISFGNYQLSVTDIAGRIGIGVVGIILIGIGVAFHIKGYSKTAISKESSFIKLKNRSEHEMSLEKRLANAKNVAFTGSSLIGILTHYKGFIQAKATTGCKFRFLLVHPDFYQGLDNRDGAERTEVLNAIELLESLSKNENIKYKVLTFHPPFSLMTVDADTSDGFVQVEMYPYSSIASERPHFELTPKIDSKWYSFFKEQFELAWQNANDYHIKGKKS